MGRWRRSVTEVSHAGNRHPLSTLQQIALDRVLIPLDAVARPVRDEEVTILQLERFGENWIGPILPFEPMCGSR